MHPAGHWLMPKQDMHKSRKKCRRLCIRSHKLIYRRHDITVKTDHMPLVTIFQKKLHKAPMRLQKMLLKSAAIFVPACISTRERDPSGRRVNPRIPGRTKEITDGWHYYDLGHRHSPVQLREVSPGSFPASERLHYRTQYYNRLPKSSI